MIEPYRRVGLLHLTLILGGFAVMALGKPVYALVVLVAVKIAVDLRAHLRERRAANPMSPAESASKMKRPPAP